MSIVLQVKSDATRNRYSSSPSYYSAITKSFCPCKGKGSDEQALLRAMLDTLKEDEILLGDAFYPTYFLLCDLVRRGIDGLFEQHGARKRSTDFGKGEKLGVRDHLIILTKPKSRTG